MSYTEKFVLPILLDPEDSLESFLQKHKKDFVNWRYYQKEKITYTLDLKFHLAICAILKEDDLEMIPAHHKHNIHALMLHPTFPPEMKFIFIQ